MPSLFLLILLSLTLASPQVRDKSHPVAITAKSAGVTSKQEVASAPKIMAVSNVATAPVVTAPPAIAIIETEAQGLSVQSEIDAPMLVKYWPSEKIELLPADVAALVEQRIGAPVETVTVAEFFKNSATIEDWMSDDEKTEAQRFQKLIGTLETQLENPRVYIFGERERTVVVIGKVKGGFGGVVTLVVET